MHALRVFDPHRLAEGAVGVSTAVRLTDTQHAFDGVAAEYDRSNRENPVLSLMRQRAIDALLRQVATGGHVLDLGCGPGTDAVTV